MKRDMDLIRKMLMDLEDGGKRAWEGLDAKDTEARQMFRYHAFLLVDAGFARGVDVACLDMALPQYSVTSLTWTGHEFLDAARDEARWNKAKGICVGVGGFAVSVLKEVLVSLVKEQIRQP